MLRRELVRVLHWCKVRKLWKEFSEHLLVDQVKFLIHISISHELN